jgi:hypothetical protein
MPGGQSRCKGPGVFHGHEGTPCVSGKYPQQIVKVGGIKQSLCNPCTEIVDIDQKRVRYLPGKGKTANQGNQKLGELFDHEAEEVKAKASQAAEKAKKKAHADAILTANPQHLEQLANIVRVNEKANADGRKVLVMCAQNAQWSRHNQLNELLSNINKLSLGENDSRGNHKPPQAYP